MSTIFVIGCFFILFLVRIQQMNKHHHGNGHSNRRRNERLPAAMAAPLIGSSRLRRVYQGQERRHNTQEDDNDTNSDSNFEVKGDYSVFASWVYSVCVRLPKPPANQNNLTIFRKNTKPIVCKIGTQHLTMKRVLSVITGYVDTHSPHLSSALRRMYDGFSVMECSSKSAPAYVGMDSIRKGGTSGSANIYNIILIKTYSRFYIQLDHSELGWIQSVLTQENIIEEMAGILIGFFIGNNKLPFRVGQIGRLDILMCN